MDDAEEAEVPPSFLVLKEYDVDPLQIGAGSFGTVHSAKKRGSDELVAVKAVSKQRMQVKAWRQAGHTDWHQLIGGEVAEREEVVGARPPFEEPQDAAGEGRRAQEELLLGCL